MSSIGDFFKKGKPRIFSCGEERSSSKAARLRNKVMIWTMAAMTAAASVGCSQSTLSAAFGHALAQTSLHVSGNHVETCKTRSGETLNYQIDGAVKDSVQLSNIKKIVNAAVATETGESVLKPFFKSNGTISLLEGESEMNGLYTSSKNAIALNAGMLSGSEKQLALMKTVLVHEAAHAKQCATGMAVTNQTGAASMIRVCRAMEADANTHGVFAASEMAERGDTLAWSALVQEIPLMAQAFNQAKKNGVSEAEVAKATMLAYYADTDYTGQYDQIYVNSLQKLASKVNGENVKSQMQKKVSSQEIASKVCTFKGKCYMGKDGGALLNDAARSSVSETTYRRLANISAEHARQVGKYAGSAVSADKSYRDLYVKAENGSYTKPFSASKILLAQNAKQSGGIRG